MSVTATGAPPRIKPSKLKTDMAVDLIGVNKWYGDFHVLRTSISR